MTALPVPVEGPHIEQLISGAVERVRSGETVIAAVEAAAIVADCDPQSLYDFLDLHAQELVAGEIQRRIRGIRQTAWQRRGATTFKKWRADFERNEPALDIFAIPYRGLDGNKPLGRFRRADCEAVIRQAVTSGRSAVFSAALMTAIRNRLPNDEAMVEEVIPAQELESLAESATTLSDETVADFI